MLRIPPEFEGKTLTIMAVKTNCPGEPISCECVKGTGVLTQMVSEDRSP